jgi:hypothetical protein
MVLLSLQILKFIVQKKQNLRQDDSEIKKADAFCGRIVHNRFFICSLSYPQRLPHDSG